MYGLFCITCCGVSVPACPVPPPVLVPVLVSPPVTADGAPACEVPVAFAVAHPELAAYGLT